MAGILGGLDWVAVTVARFGLPLDFVRFGMVGVAGFCWDTATVYGLRGLIGVYAALAMGFVVAASANWVLNRWWTFKGRAHEPMHVQYVRFVSVNSVGFIFNRGISFALVAAYAVVKHQPVLGIMAGSAAGLTFNYFLSKIFVFR